MTKKNEGVSFFAQFIGDPEPTKVENQQLASAQRLLDWIYCGWTKDTIHLKDFCIYGPRPRDRKSVLARVEILAARGWLVPTETRRYDALKWRIIRKATVSPRV